MSATVIRAGVLAWLLLALLTGITWWIGVDHPGSSTRPRIDTTVLILLAFCKARLIILYFMELRRAPLPLRLAGEAWVFAVGIAVLATYFLTAP